ncbi:LysM peptidoglycan-binding domain-containing protein [Weissella paramesenteroides]|uniref:LysM peptidoglycan-binding domain-containing protein n=1 Tax=Weissella paramesenteroides TaxID=1249 RepID=UPI002158AE60|nr:LysM peptidoglycan-binding domain-containing protein [Weissella paramesenteroides]
MLALAPAQEDGAEPTDTTSQTPSDDTNSGDESTEPDQPAEPIKVSSFDLDKTSLSGEAGGTEVVTLSNIQPTDATDKAVEVVLDDGSIVSVQDNGDSTYTVSFLAAGSTTIHWNSRDDGTTLAVPVTVTEPVPTAPELQPWEIMLINHESAPYPVPTTDTYTVQAGETLADIATAHMMSLARLKKLNGLTVNSLPAGRVIRLS